MCGRYSHILTWSEIHTLSGLLFPTPQEEPTPNYNVAPTQFCPVVVSDGAHIWGERATWGLIPFWWSKDLSEKKFTTINAKAEEITQKSTYKVPVRRHRALVPANCFYEWRKSDKQPFAIGIRGEGASGLSPFFMAGIWTHWAGHLNAAPFEAYSFSILTRAAGDEMALVHPREPAILLKEEIEAWLKAPLDQILPQILQPLPSQLRHYFPIEKRVGQVSNNDPDLWRPLCD